MTPIVYRPFTPDEAARLTALRLEALANAPEAFGERVDVARARGGEDFSAALGEGAIFGAFAGENPVGMAGFERWRGANVAHKATVWGVYVAPVARGRGVGEGLFEAIFAHARAVGVEVLELGVGDFNAHAQTLYRRLGFEPFGLERKALKYFDRYIDEVLMAKFL